MAGARERTAGRRREGFRAVLAAVVVTAALGLPGCGGDSTSPTAIMNVTMTFAPDPTTAVASDQEGFDWVASYTVTVRNSGGLAGAVTGVIVNVYENVDGTAGAQTTTVNTDLQYDSSRLEANGTLALSFNTYYTLPNEGKAVLVDVFVYFVDDDGFEGQVGGRLSVE